MNARSGGAHRRVTATLKDHPLVVVATLVIAAIAACAAVFNAVHQDHAAEPRSPNGPNVLVNTDRVKVTGGSRPSGYAVYTGGVASLPGVGYCKPGSTQAFSSTLFDAKNQEYILNVTAKANVVVNVGRLDVHVTSRGPSPTGVELTCGGGASSQAIGRVALDEPGTPVAWNVDGVAQDHPAVACTASDICSITLVFDPHLSTVSYTADLELLVDGTPLRVSIPGGTVAGTAKASGVYLQDANGDWTILPGVAP